MNSTGMNSTYKQRWLAANRRTTGLTDHGNARGDGEDGGRCPSLNAAGAPRGASPKPGTGLTRRDPTGTVTMRRRFKARLARGWKQLRGEVRRLLIEEDAFGLAPPQAFSPLGGTSPVIGNAGRWLALDLAGKVGAFATWLGERLGAVMGSGVSSAAAWTRYLSEGAARGAGAVWQSLRRGGKLPGAPRLSVPPLGSAAAAAGGGAQARRGFLAALFGSGPVKERLRALYERAGTELRNLWAYLLVLVRRVLTDGLLLKAPAAELAGAVAKILDLGRGRAEDLTDDLLIGSYADAQLDALGALGVEEVEALVEWETAGPPYHSELSYAQRRRLTHVCRRCETLEGRTYLVSEAYGLIPLHTYCRCSWRAAGYGRAGSVPFLPEDEHGDDEV